MPWIIDYQTVFNRLTAEGLRCNYYNGGVFGFPPEAGAQVRGWIGPPDSTIKPEAQPLTRTISEPFEETLADSATSAWLTYLPGNVWVLPGSHWAYELNHGGRDWMPALIENLDLDPGLLVNRNNAAAIEFAPQESPQFRHFILRLLEMLSGSDFCLAFPQRGTVGTIHHHKQIWWVTIDSQVMHGLDALLPIK